METLVKIPKTVKSTRDTIQALRKLPFGQRMIRAGFKVITYDNLMDRMGCTAINKEIDKKAENKTKRIQRFLNYKLSKKHPITRWFAGGYYRRSAWWNGEAEDGEPPYYWAVYQKNELTDILMSDCPPRRRCVHCEEWGIGFFGLSEYSEGKIPARCLRSVQKAIALGVKHLWVAKPEKLDIKDPVILATEKTDEGEADAPYYEIDMWE